MGAVRQAATVLVYAFVPGLLVIGSLALALTESHPAPVATPSPLRQVLSPTDRPAAAPTSSQSSPVTATATPKPITESPTLAPPPTATQILHADTPTPASPSPAASAQAQMAIEPTMGCGPFQGWIMGYVVRPGDTLYRIAARYRISVSELKQGNCRTSSLIHVGERLWVPSFGSRWAARPTSTAPSARRWTPRGTSTPRGR